MQNILLLSDPFKIVHRIVVLVAVLVIDDMVIRWSFHKSKGNESMDKKDMEFSFLSESHAEIAIRSFYWLPEFYAISELAKSYSLHAATGAYRIVGKIAYWFPLFILHKKTSYWNDQHRCLGDTVQ